MKTKWLWLVAILAFALVGCVSGNDDDTAANDDDIPLCGAGMELVGDDCVPACGDGLKWDVGEDACVSDCPDGEVFDNEAGECVEIVQSLYEYSISFNNPRPRGGESFHVGGWEIDAFCPNCIEEVSVQEAANRDGLYYFTGPDLSASSERLVLHGVHPCFDELQITVTLEKTKTLQWTVARNDIQCTDKYEMDCAYITDEFLYEAASHYLSKTPNVDSCCEKYPNTTQAVCLACPDFDANNCMTNEYVGLVDGECLCVGLDMEPRNYDVSEVVEPPIIEGYTRCNVDTNNDGLFNDYCVCNNTYLLLCEYDLDPTPYDPPNTWGYGDGCGSACNDHCACDPGQ